MRAWMLLALLLPLAGCVEDIQDSSMESTTITIGSHGPFQAGIPLLVSDDGASLSEWLATFRVGGNATLAIRDLDRGPVLWIEGDGNVLLDAQDLVHRTQGRLSEAYLGSEWSARPLPDGDPLFYLESGFIDLIFSYEGTSSRCYVTATYSSVGMEPGWNAPDDNPYPSRNTQCT